jgi:hypothetical protein
LSTRRATENISGRELVLKLKEKRLDRILEVEDSQLKLREEVALVQTLPSHLGLEIL